MICPWTAALQDGTKNVNWIKEETLTAYEVSQLKWVEEITTILMREVSSRPATRVYDERLLVFLYC